MSYYSRGVIHIFCPLHLYFCRFLRFWIFYWILGQTWWWGRSPVWGVQERRQIKRSAINGKMRGDQKTRREKGGSTSSGVRAPTTVPPTGHHCKASWGNPRLRVGPLWSADDDSRIGRLSCLGRVENEPLRGTWGTATRRSGPWWLAAASAGPSKQPGGVLVESMPESYIYLLYLISDFFGEDF